MRGKHAHLAEAVRRHAVHAHRVAHALEHEQRVRPARHLAPAARAVSWLEPLTRVCTRG
jgi:hypothetical protein